MRVRNKGPGTERKARQREMRRWQEKKEQDVDVGGFHVLQCSFSKLILHIDCSDIHNLWLTFTVFRLAG